MHGVCGTLDAELEVQRVSPQESCRSYDCVR